MNRPHLQPERRSPTQICALLVFFTLALLGWRFAQAQTEVLKLETWRTEDEARWVKQIIPAFNRTHPSTKLLTLPSPAVEYDANLLNKFNKNTAGDLITCRPFDASLELW